MTINALDILASTAVAARCHSGYNTQRLKLGFRRDTIMLVGALVSIRALMAEVVDIAHLEFAHTFYVALVEIARRIHALSFAIARNAWWTRGSQNGFDRRWCVRHSSGSLGFASPCSELSIGRDINGGHGFGGRHVLVAGRYVIASRDEIAAQYSPWRQS